MTPTTNSDSEDDLDYVPPADDDDSDSSNGQVHVETAPAATAPDPAEQKKRRNALWASFQASLPLPSDATTAAQPAAPVHRVQIEKTYLFAGKRITEVVEVAEDSDDAKKWPRYSRPPAPSNQAPEGREHNGSPSPQPQTVDPRPAPSQTTTTTTKSTSRPGPRKPRTVLPSIPKASQAKKLTTLDKSAMDWRAHVAAQSSDVQDELDVNKRGGGYLEKVDFLQRVQDRREEAFEASKANKRRRT